jgi:hypothetical protein
VRLKREKAAALKAEERAADVREERRIVDAIEAEQRAMTKDAPAFSNFPDQSENIMRSNVSGGGGKGGNRGRVVNSPPPQVQGPDLTLALARGGGENISNVMGTGGGGGHIVGHHEASRRKLGFSEIPGLENHRPPGPSAPSTPPPPAAHQRPRTPAALGGARTPDPALRSMVDGLQAEQQRLRTEIEAQVGPPCRRRLSCYPSPLTPHPSSPTPHDSPTAHTPPYTSHHVRYLVTSCWHLACDNQSPRSINTTSSWQPSQSTQQD